MANFNHQQRQLKTMRGMAAVEFAILMAFIFAPLVLGTVEIGRVLYQYNNIVKNVRASARYISLYSATYPNYAAREDEAIEIALCGSINCTPDPTQPAVVTVTESAVAEGTVVIQLVEVSVTGYELGYVTNIFDIDGFKAFNDISVAMQQATT